ncbi:hypothetical protein FNJ87_17130 [Nonlabens mediterrranea]|uniref:DUF4870 domain-containing protein n=1 Tax=Nonlabens mediterrranea TaxID=1419947 RepID=A0ABS0A9G5_9FLAO|nr:hypothetical protein [Nonlabens mediterrranea]MBF4985975.1 hypothetical protein [Nonlabens mediterrranea]
MDKEPAGKSIAIIAYASALFLFFHLIVCIAIFGVAIILNNGKNQPFATFHLRQMFGIIAAAVIASVFASAIPTGIIPLLMICFFVLLALLGLVSALRNQTDALPIVGPLFQKWFNFIK